MIDIVERYLEIAISIFIYVSSALLTLTLLMFAQDPIITQGSDKTFIESTGVQVWDEHELYGEDILLMLLNLDSMSPYPKAIRLNDSPVIKLDNQFLVYKITNVGNIYTESGEYKLSTMLDWKVTSKEFVYSGTDAPYIQYILEEVVE